MKLPRTFWIPRIGIFVMLLGIGLELQGALSRTAFLAIEGCGVLLGALGLVYVVRAYRRKESFR